MLFVVSVIIALISTWLRTVEYGRHDVRTQKMMVILMGQAIAYALVFAKISWEPNAIQIRKES